MFLAFFWPSCWIGFVLDAGGNGRRPVLIKILTSSLYSIQHCNYIDYPDHGSYVSTVHMYPYAIQSSRCTLFISHRFSHLFSTCHHIYRDLSLHVYIYLYICISLEAVPALSSAVPSSSVSCSTCSRTNYVFDWWRFQGRQEVIRFRPSSTDWWESARNENEIEIEKNLYR